MNPATRAAGPRIIVALDYPHLKDALGLVERLDPVLCRLKVGLELYTAEGPAAVAALVGRGFDVFLDLKYHDIPNTVARACRVAADLGVWMLNVHTLGGRAMMQAARQALEGSGRRPLLIGVTLLTSHSQADIAEVGLGAGLTTHAERLAALAQEAGLDGVVCSAHEAATLRAGRGAEFVLVTPGIRPAGSDPGDQTRVVTPAQAVELGSNYLVVGRPVTQAPDPVAMLEQIQKELRSITVN